MGINLTGLRALGLAKRLGFNFERCITLGRHEVFLTAEEYSFVRMGGGLGERAPAKPFSGFQEPLLQFLGGKIIHSIDASNYEGATVVADFNKPISGVFSDRCSTYLDFGSMEHIFDVAQVVRNVKSLLDVGGNLLIVTDCDGHAGHGLYQFSPEFFYSAFGSDNGFSNTTVFIVDDAAPRMWHLIRPPKVAKERVNIPEGRQYTIVCLAEKSDQASSIEVQQSDYVDQSWKVEGHRHLVSKKRIGALSAFRKIALMPYLRARSLVHKLRKTRKFSLNSIALNPDILTAEQLRRMVNR